MSAWNSILLALLAVAAFHLAYGFVACSFLIVVYLWCMFELTRLRTARRAYYFGLGVGILCFGPQMHAFWILFGPAAIALWYVLGFWTGLFLVLGRSCRMRLGNTRAALLIPILWTGLEYFRSELYYLRFSWLNAGFAFSETLQWLPMKLLGVYGIGFVLMGIIGLLSLLAARQRMIAGTAALGLLAILTLMPAKHNSPAKPTGLLPVAGFQLEFPLEFEVLSNLDCLVANHPEAQLLVLSEYTFDGPVPNGIKAWCKRNGRFLIIGAKDPAPNTDFYDTAFVIGPDGNIAFRQGKSVPVQFLKDGLPAEQQRLWESPWGRIGICICYDLSYARVMDELIRLGAQAIIVPTMDVETWGRREHELHARVAPVKAAEYGVPIFRVASSGISQCVNARGQVEATAPMPGDGAVITGVLQLSDKGRLPLDRLLAPVSVWVTGGYLIAAAYLALKRQPNRSVAF